MYQWDMIAINKPMHKRSINLQQKRRDYTVGKTVSSIRSVGKTGHYPGKMKLDHLLTQYLKTNSKWIKDLKVRPETIKLLEENIFAVYSLLVLEIFFAGDLSLQAKVTKAKLNDWDLIKLKKLLHREGIHQQNGRRYLIICPIKG